MSNKRSRQELHPLRKRRRGGFVANPETPNEPEPATAVTGLPFSTDVMSYMTSFLGLRGQSLNSAVCAEHRRHYLKHPHFGSIHFIQDEKDIPEEGMIQVLERVRQYSLVPNPLGLPQSHLRELRLNTLTPTLWRLTLEQNRTLERLWIGNEFGGEKYEFTRVMHALKYVRCYCLALYGRAQFLPRLEYSFGLNLESANGTEYVFLNDFAHLEHAVLRHAPRFKAAAPRLKRLVLMMGMFSVKEYAAEHVPNLKYMHSLSPARFELLGGLQDASWNPCIQRLEGITICRPDQARALREAVSLHSLELYCRVTPQIVRDSPQVKNVKLFDFQQEDMKKVAEWSQLTHLEVEGRSLSDLVIPSEMQSLELVSAGIRSLRQVRATSTGPVASLLALDIPWASLNRTDNIVDDFPHLVYLGLSWSNMESLGTQLSRLPRLQQLRIYDDADDQPRDATFLSECLALREVFINSRCARSYVWPSPKRFLPTLMSKKTISLFEYQPPQHSAKAKRNIWSQHQVFECLEDNEFDHYY